MKISNLHAHTAHKKKKRSVPEGEVLASSLQPGGIAILAHDLRFSHRELLVDTSSWFNYIQLNYIIRWY